MGSPRLRPEGARRAWLCAIAAWAAFLGAALGVLVALLALPSTDAGWEALSLLFLGHWLATAIAIALALVLARPLFEAGAGGR